MTEKVVCIPCRRELPVAVRQCIGTHESLSLALSVISNIADDVLSALRISKWLHLGAAMQSGTAECFNAFVSR